MYISRPKIKDRRSTYIIIGLPVLVEVHPSLLLIQFGTREDSAHVRETDSERRKENLTIKNQFPFSVPEKEIDFWVVFVLRVAASEASSKKIKDQVLSPDTLKHKDKDQRSKISLTCTDCNGAPCRRKDGSSTSRIPAVSRTCTVLLSLQKHPNYSTIAFLSSLNTKSFTGDLEYKSNQIPKDQRSETWGW